MSLQSKIIIGSAQFGMRYGIANTSGQIPISEITKILCYAHANYIHMVDTASMYGNSETVIGNNSDYPFKIITKLPPVQPNHIDDIGHYVNSEYSKSLLRLKRNTCEALLVHQVNDLYSPYAETLYKSLSQLKEDKVVNKIGISVYHPQQVKSIINKYEFDIIQFPLNVLDQRFLEDGLLTELKNRNIELHARSIFLQGLLLMEIDDIPADFNEIKPLLVQLQYEAGNDFTALRRGLMKFVNSIEEIDHYIIGINSLNQFKDIVNDIDHFDKIPDIAHNKYKYHCMKIIDPSQWGKAI